jgi:DNA-binding NarL/FixJ family response regulator
MIKIILADDHQIVRHGLRTLLSAEPDLEVVGEAENGREVVRLVQELSPQVVIMDISMPDLNGIEATRQIVDDSSGVKVIALSMHSDGLFVLNMFKAGASGYLLKDAPWRIGQSATVMNRQVYLSPGISDIVIKDFVIGWSSEESSSSAYSILTARERQVLQLMAEGKSTNQIADTLFVSVKTVEAHRKQLMNKLDIHNVAELTNIHPADHFLEV